MLKLLLFDLNGNGFTGYIIMLELFLENYTIEQSERERERETLIV